jgi:hypothetical protein
MAPGQFFQDGISKLVYQWDKILSVQSNYVEK